ncbi:hypothetical protein DSECCO2_90720 [anaerobic digester metagenome]
MHIRKILICVLTSMLCIGIFCPKAADAAQTPQEFVKEFYEWYIIKHYEQNDILENENLPKYVDESLIEELKRKWPSDLYYFIHFSETLAFKNCRIVVKDILKMTDDVFVVPVMFKGEKFESTVIAYVKKVDSVFKIASVSDIYPY